VKGLKGLILSGGHGTRLRPLTYTSAKQLIPIANKPVLFYGIEAMKRAGIEDISIVVGHTRAEIQAAVGDGSRFGVRVRYVEQDAPRGLAHAVQVAEESIGDHPFMMYLGDNFLLDGVSRVVEEFDQAKHDARILLARVRHPEHFGVAVVDGERVTRLVEKPKHDPPSNLGIIGVYVFSPIIFQACRSIAPSARGELEITDAIQWLVDRERNVTAQVVEGYWKDTGKPEDLLDANRMVLDRLHSEMHGDLDADSRVEFRVVVGKGTKIRRSVIRGPVLIGENAVIEDAYIGPFTSIGNGCSVKNAEIEHSILLEGSKLAGVSGRVVDSLLGKGASVVHADERPQAFRFVVGDHSAVGI
jgi:glucose-1-phosphate thymidylyltransferase